jgi:transcriptional regulator with XRE-family HTH domain
MTDKNKGGRPPVVLSPEQISEVQTLSAVLSQEQIADYFGISRPTFNEIMKRQPEVSLQYKKGKAKAIASVASNLITSAREGNTASQIFYLKTQAGWKEQEAQTNELPAINIILANETDDTPDQDIH